ncbi:DMT family transporter [Methylophilus methylotrophus]|uniref:DMT family transporter n=1 Tax=Methylophilus methylotrophus TaxID=17 RepID=UPI0004767420|nr:multidrug efflux SMR transporter [Methylophilus methylotrophus]
MKWLYLALAICFELLGTSALKSTIGFTKLGPSLLTILGYAVAFYFLSLSLKEIPIGIAYAIWSAVGIVLVAIIGYFVYGQVLDKPAIFGMGLIISGVVIMNTMSESIVP